MLEAFNALIKSGISEKANKEGFEKAVTEFDKLEKLSFINDGGASISDVKDISSKLIKTLRAKKNEIFDTRDFEKENRPNQKSFGNLTAIAQEGREQYTIWG